MIAIGEKIKKLFEQRGMSQGEFGRRLGLEASAISRLLNGQHALGIDYVKKMADVLDRKMSCVLQDTNYEGKIKEDAAPQTPAATWRDLVPPDRDLLGLVRLLSSSNQQTLLLLLDSLLGAQARPAKRSLTQILDSKMLPALDKLGKKHLHGSGDRKKPL